MLSPESAVAFNIGSFEIRYYGLIMLCSIVLGGVLIYFTAKKYYPEVNRAKLFDILPMIILWAILGARMYYIALDWDYYCQHIAEIPAIWHGGLSIHGALLGGIISGAYYLVKNKLNFWMYADLIIYGVVLGQIAGRLGNYFNVEAFGKPCSNEVLCLFIPPGFRPSQYLSYEYFHPAFMYEMIWNAFVLLILLFVVRKYAKQRYGIVFFSYLILYSIGRLLIEGLRIDSVLNVGGFHIAQIVSIILILAGIIGNIILLRCPTKGR